MRKRGLLTQKAIAGMNDITARRPRNGHKLLAIQVRGGSSPSQGMRLICLANVQSARVIFGKNSHDSQAQFRGGTRNADRNLAPVGYQ